MALCNNETYDLDIETQLLLASLACEDFEADRGRIKEYLSKHVTNTQPTNLQPRGLKNPSTYCYVNSVLQSLLTCSPFYNLLKGLDCNATDHGGTPMLNALCRFVGYFKNLSTDMNQLRIMEKSKDEYVLSDTPFQPFWLHQMRKKNSQEDAEEFLSWVLHLLRNEMAEVMNTSPIDTPIGRLFGGSLRTTIYGSTKETISNVQPFFTLPVTVEDTRTTLIQALENLTAFSELEDAGGWQTVRFEKLPTILVVHLMRCKFISGEIVKVTETLDFPIDLRIDSGMLSPESGIKKQMYRLISVVHHRGIEAGRGHNLTDAFHPGYKSWIRYNDDKVASIMEEQVLWPEGSLTPYLLFYQKADSFVPNSESSYGGLQEVN